MNISSKRGSLRRVSTAQVTQTKRANVSTHVRSVSFNTLKPRARSPRTYFGCSVGATCSCTSAGVVPMTLSVLICNSGSLLGLPVNVIVRRSAESCAMRAKFNASPSTRAASCGLWKLVLFSDEMKPQRMLTLGWKFPASLAAESGQPITGSATTLKPDMKLSDVKLENYVGVILPCMAAGSDPTSIQIPPEAVKIVKQAVAQGKPVAAQQSAIKILVTAGVLGGKHIASQGQGVVQDGNITTAGTCPYTVKTQGAKIQRLN